MKEVILVDPHASGHHLSYLRIYASILLKSGCKVSVLCADVPKVEEYMSMLMLEYRGRLHVLDLYRRRLSELEVSKNERNGIIRDLIETYSVYRNFKEVTVSIKIHNLKKNSLVFIMWLDAYICKYLFPSVLYAIFPYRWAGLYFHPSHIKYNIQRNERYRDLLYYVPIFSSRKLALVGLFDGKIVDRLQGRYGRNVFDTLPDIAETHTPILDSAIVCDILNRARGRKIVSLLGSLDRRKNVVSFLEAAVSCSNDDIFYVCSGKLHKRSFHDEDLKYIYRVSEMHSDKIYFNDKHVDSDSIFDTIFQISDLIVAVYNNFTSSSNMITKAANYSKYIIVSDEFLMGEIVKKYNIGRCVKGGKPDELLNAINFIFENRERIGGRFKDYVRNNSIEKINDCFYKILKNT